MPELDGFQVVQAIRERERTTGKHLPVIALTARSRKEDRQQCLAAGMDAFLTKPVQAADLWAAIDRVLAGGPPADRNPNERNRLDARVVLAACGRENTILRTLCRKFQTSLPDQLAAARDALRAADAHRLREAAHKLSSTVGTFSGAAGVVASDLEDRAASGQLDKCAPLMDQLEALADDLLRQVDGLTIESLLREDQTV
jgi:two-component system sensor histidine kinase/response regulator